MLRALRVTQRLAGKGQNVRFYAVTAPQFHYEDLFQHDAAHKVETPYRKLTGDFVSTLKVGEKEFLQVCPAAQIMTMPR